MKRFLFPLLLLLSPPSQAALNVFACEPEWAALAQQLGGDKVNVFTATGPLQDMHRIEARPNLIARARRADLTVCTGADLEIAWLPIIQRESGNGAIQPGNAGSFEASRYVQMLEVPGRLDRAEGDVHPMGNPHIQTDARNFLPIADALTSRMAQLDPANAAYYQQQLATFKPRWQTAIARWEKLAAPLRGIPILAQHRGFPYLNNWLGMKQLATLEPKPGMEPSVAYLGQILGALQQQPAKLVLRAAYQDERPSVWVAERAHIAAVVVPFTVGGTPQATDLYALFDDTINRLLAGSK